LINEREFFDVNCSINASIMFCLAIKKFHSLSFSVGSELWYPQNSPINLRMAFKKNLDNLSGQDNAESIAKKGNVKKNSFLCVCYPKNFIFLLYLFHADSFVKYQISSTNQRIASLFSLFLQNQNKVL
jgi:hypothetical protein